LAWFKKKKKEEEYARKIKEEQNKKKKEEDALRKLRDEEQLRKLKEQEQLRKLQEAELKRLKEEEQVRKLREEEQKRRLEEEHKERIEAEQLRKMKEDELRRLREEEKLNRMREEEQLRKIKEEAERQKQMKLEGEKDNPIIDYNPWNLKPEDNNTFPDPFKFESPKYMNPLEASTTEFVHINTAKTNEGDIKLIGKPDHVECGENINVIWEHPTKPNANDWIALYPINTTQDKDYLSFYWVNPEKTGSISIKTPSKPGTYVFKYFVNRSYVCWASSNTFRVGPAYRLTPTVVGTLQVKINIEQIFGSPSSSGWIGMYEEDKDNKSYHQYHYLSDKKEILFIAPKSGKWVFRVFPSKAYDYTDSITVDL